MIAQEMGAAAEEPVAEAAAEKPVAEAVDEKPVHRFSTWL